MFPELQLMAQAVEVLALPHLDGLQIVYAPTVARLHHPPLEPEHPALVLQWGDAPPARVEQTLRNAYPEQHRLTLVRQAGTSSQKVWAIPLADLHRQTGLDASTVLYLPPLPREAGFTTFQETIAHLRAPEGCPWDRKQTHLTLRPYLLEETYEVLEALDAEDPDALAEELGDLLLQVVLHTQIAVEYGEFKMADVLGHINRKLWRRHPHVFGDVEVSSVDEVTANWEAIKKAEKARTNGGADTAASALDGVPKGLPALAQAMAISKKAARVGFEWPNIQGVLDKIVEEAAEIVQAGRPEEVESEIGDLLFAVVNLARWKNVDPESALRETNARFGRRFRRLEALAAARGRSLDGMTIEELDALWEQAKREEVRR